MALTKLTLESHTWRPTFKSGESSLLLLPANSIQPLIARGRVASQEEGRMQEDSQVPVHFATNIMEKTCAEQPPRRGAAHNILKEELHQERRLAWLLWCAEPEWETLDTENWSDIRIYCHALFSGKGEWLTTHVSATKGSISRKYSMIDQLLRPPHHTEISSEQNRLCLQREHKGRHWKCRSN